MPPNRRSGPARPAELVEVLDRLAAVRDGAAARDPGDGVAAFVRHHHDATARVAELVADGRAAAPEFLVALAVGLADRFQGALREHDADPGRAPAAWRVLLDHRADPGVPAGAFVVAGFNAALNLDLAAVLVDTWEHRPPDEGGPGSAQYRDYCLLVDVVESAVEPLREGLGATGAAHVTDLAIRFTRDLAWDEAREVWTDGADEERRRRSAEKLDAIAALLGAHLLGRP
jgi:uncharacterized protein DUF5995